MKTDSKDSSQHQEQGQVDDGPVNKVRIRRMNRWMRRRWWRREMISWDFVMMVIVN